MPFTTMLLLLALSLSWPRFVIIFRPGMDGAVAQSTLTMAASAISVSSLGLAMVDQGAMTKSLLILTALLVARLWPKEMMSGAAIMSCASLCTYLHLVERVG